MAAPDLLSGSGASNPISVELATLIHRILQIRKSFIDAGQVCHLYSRTNAERGVRDLREWEHGLVMNVCYTAYLQLRTENIDIRRFTIIMVKDYLWRQYEY